MPGIADSNVQALAPANSAAFAGEQSVSPGVGDLMGAFRSGFITTEDITKRSLDKPLENAQRQQALADTNIVRPKQREIAEKELALKSGALDTAAKNQPMVAEATAADAERMVGEAKEALENFKKGGDIKAFTDAWRRFFPGEPLLRDEKGSIDYKGGVEKLEVEGDRLRNLEAAKVIAGNIKTSTVEETNPQTKKKETILVGVDPSGRVVSRTVVGAEAVPLNDQQAGSLRYSGRMNFNQKLLLENEASGFDATSLTTTAKKLFLPNRLQGEQLQTYTSAKNNWIAANLRKESGAAIAPKEYKDADAQYFPQDGDDEAVVAQKQARRELAEEDMHKSIGPSAPDRIKGAAPAASPAAAAPAQPVTVNNLSEAPATAELVRSSKTGKTYKNPKYVAPPTQ